ncbi:MAG: virulence factor [Granulosicoccus sp.]
MPELIKIYWRDIPSQVTAKAGRKTAKVMLPSRFQEGIDRAAMRAGKGSSDAYMEDWRRERSPCGSELQHEAEQAAEALIASFSEAYLEALVKAKGLADNVSEEIKAINNIDPQGSVSDKQG